MGVYTGVTPCADCEGIYTRLEFLDSVTYIKASKYLGKSSRAFLDMGQWSIQNDSVVALIAHGNSQRYLLEGNGLVMLNSEGKRIKGALANYYQLAKGEPEGNRNWIIKSAEGIDFAAQGNEPYWNLEIDFDKGIRFSTLDGDSMVTTLPTAVNEGSSLLYTIDDNGVLLNLKLSPVGCINSMSGAYSDYAVEVTFKDNAMMSGCGEFINSFYHLTGTWQLATLNKETVKESDFGKGLPELTFSAIDKKVSGSSGCNRLTGGFTSSSEGTLTFLPLASTRMMCEGKGESIFLKALNTVTHYRIESDKLLLMKGEDEVMVLTSGSL